MSRSRPFRVLGVLLAAAAPVACGTSEDTADADIDAGAGEGAEAITITDSRGEEVVLEDGPAERVVALEWMHAENLVTLGVEPVGVADVDGYTTWAPGPGRRPRWARTWPTSARAPSPAWRPSSTSSPT